MTFLETVCSRSAPLPSTPLSCSGSLTGGKQRPLVQFLLSCSGSLTGEIRAPHIGIGSKPMSGRCSGAMAMECVSVKIETSLGYVMFFLLHKLISEIEIQSWISFHIFWKIARPHFLVRSFDQFSEIIYKLILLFKFHCILIELLVPFFQKTKTGMRTVTTRYSHSHLRGSSLRLLGPAFWALLIFFACPAPAVDRGKSQIID